MSISRCDCVTFLDVTQGLGIFPNTGTRLGMSDIHRIVSSNFRFIEWNEALEMSIATTFLRSNRHIRPSTSSQISSLFLRLPPSYRAFHASPESRFLETAVSSTHTILQGIHSISHLPWACAIPLAAVGVRTILVLPLAVYVQRMSQKRVELNPLVSAWKHQLQKEVMAESAHLGPAATQKALVKKLKRKQKELYAQFQCQSWKSYLPILQLPIWLTFIETIRRMCGVNFGLLGRIASWFTPEESGSLPIDYYTPLVGVEETFSTEGALWFQDLLQPDPLFVLPFVLSGLLLLNLSSALGKNPTLLQRTVRTGSRVLAMVMVPTTMYFPSAMLVYWISSSSIAYFQARTLKRFMPLEPLVKPYGRKERVQFDKITARVSRLCYGLDTDHVDAAAITQKVISGVYQGVTTVELDNLAAETAAYMTVTHPDYAILAARIAVSNLHKQTKKQFSTVISDLYHYINPRNGKPSPMISQRAYECVMKHEAELNSAIVYDRDFNYQYFGFKTLERSYLLRLNGAVAERPQQMIMRVAVGIHFDDIESVIETYNLMSSKYFTHASPTLFSAGTPQGQLSSCFLIDMKEDSIDGIYDTLKTCAMISKNAGGIGLNIHRIRATGAYIAGTNGNSNGIVPMLRVFNNTARYVDQGGNKRPGAFAIYLEPWHADVFEFLDLRKNHGKEEVRARDLFYALWIPDLFMKRVEKNGEWTLMCPNECPGLADVYGDEFEALYEKYEKEGKGRKTIKAQKLWYSILEAQTETGNPFMLYKDSCNRKSNQKNLGTIRSSNLCTEIIEYCAPDEVAVCNLASLALPTFVDKDNGFFDFEKLHEVTQVVTRNLNKIIDINYYPVPEARKSNFRHRPIAVGVQGLADAFLALRLPFDCPDAKQLNIQIFETIYMGQLQYDLWGVTPSGLWDWDTLKQQIKQHGIRNSLLVAPMPTASTSQILGFNECFEPYTSNIYSRRVLAGEFQVVNPWLLKDLVDMGLWSDNMKNRIIADGGSIQNIPNIPADIKALYKTVWEISQRNIVQMAADRGAFIDQSQSMNIHMKDPTMGKITSMHFAGWKLGLKTGMYYLRTMAASAPIQFTVDQEALLVADTNVARERKKRPSTGYTGAAAPRPMMYKKPSADAPNGIPTPTATPPPASEKTHFVTPVPFKADIDEGDSPKNLATEPAAIPPKEEQLPEPSVPVKKQEEDKADESANREHDIYADAVLQCSIDNKEECMMCSG
ncbi:hypothetical protein B7494_g8258 [Chlorociboria aeruginascens]|nr:hypothetical protein B7494_g8258 [Chlorociboria aeruginascens]